MIAPNAYDAAWHRLRERSDWIEMGFGTPQIDVSSFKRPIGSLIRYIEDESGVLAAAKQPALALTVIDSSGERQLLVVKG